MIHLDFETRATVPFGRAKGAVTAYQYARHPETSVWCMCYAFKDGPVLNLHLPNPTALDQAKPEVTPSIDGGVLPEPAPVVLPAAQAKLAS